MTVIAPRGPSHMLVSAQVSSEQPIPVRQGPLGFSDASPGGPFWFQQGAFGRASAQVCETCNSVGASVMIRTVYDGLNNDAHSYWVGSLLPNCLNGQCAFVQVGYLNGLTTTGQYYCCAWFFEYFPPGNTTSPPIIGLPGSAGPIGSWHTYSMNSSAGNVWSFYMDNQYLGSSPAAGNTWNLGASNTGNNPVAALSEVADANYRTDVIGPAEFKNLEYELGPNSLQPVQTGTTHIGCGQAPTSCLPNPYGVAEMERASNDFLSGSLVPAGQDECGNSAGNGATLWSPSGLTSCLVYTNFSFSFVDRDGANFSPAWISLIDNSGTEIFFTNYQSQQLISPTGQWRINQVSWHSVNVTLNQDVSASPGSQVFLTNVFSIRLSVNGYLYSLPVKDATVIMYLPDSTNQTMRTDANGQALFSQLPPSSYSFHISVPYGITSNQVHSVNTPGSIIAKVFSLPELITIIVPPILFAIIASAVVARREHRRQAMMPPLPFYPSTAGPMYCRHCGQPLAPTANFCTSCGTPVRMAIQ